MVKTLLLDEITTLRSDLELTMEVGQILLTEVIQRLGAPIIHLLLIEAHLVVILLLQIIVEVHPDHLQIIVRDHPLITVRDHLEAEEGTNNIILNFK